MPKILILDTYYPQFLESVYINGALPYEEELQRVLSLSFGTFDAYSRALTAEGWECRDVIVNSKDLQSRWAYEHQKAMAWHRGNPDQDKHILREQIADFQPDVIFLQDASIELPVIAAKSKIVAQISCAMPQRWHPLKPELVFTSFPHYVGRFEKMGIRAVYLPLAFDPIVLERAGGPFERIHDVTFVGGVGKHWERGTSVLEAVAQEIPTFSWYGYGLDSLRTDSPLRAKYRGSAFGLDMYRIFLQSKIVINRHGEVAEGYANNLRLFEVTGCGAMLLTDNKTDLFTDDEIVSYSSATEAAVKVEYFLAYDKTRERIAANGQARTLRDHTYRNRMERVSEVLTGMLTAA